MADCRAIPPRAVTGRYAEIIREWYTCARAPGEHPEMRVCALRLLTIHGYARCILEEHFPSGNIRYAEYVVGEGLLLVTVRQRSA